MKTFIKILVLIPIFLACSLTNAHAQPACCTGENYFNLGVMGWLKSTHYYQGKCVDQATYACLKLNQCWDSPDAQGLCIGGESFSWLSTQGRICREKATYLFSTAPKMQCRAMNLNGYPPNFTPDYGQYCNELSTPGADPTTFQCVNRSAITDDQRGYAPCPAPNQTESCVATPFGMIRTSPGGLVSQIIALGTYIGSGVALLLLIYGSYIVLTSQGNPEGINHGKEIITSAIIGLVFIIISVSLMQIIGFDILGLGALGLGTR